jgi:excisionase family DNA binding protein
VTLTGDYLRTRGLPFSEQEFVEALERLSTPAPTGGGHLSRMDLEFLTAHGGVDATTEVRASVQDLATIAGVAVTSLDVEQVAELLGISTSRVRHQLADGALYSLKAGRKRLLPRWQFAGDRPLPGLSGVLAALAGDLHPVAVERWFVLPHDTLEVDGQPVSPREWLAGGGDPAPVVALARDIGAF